MQLALVSRLTERGAVSDSDQSGMVQTVLGLVPPESLRPTTTHEHLLINFEVMFHAPSEASERYKAFQPVSMENLAWIGYDPFRNLDNCRLLDEGRGGLGGHYATKMAGGGTMVDATDYRHRGATRLPSRVSPG